MYIYFAPEESQDFLEVLWDHGPTLLYFHLHQLVYFILALDILLELNFQVELLILQYFPLGFLLHFGPFIDQVGISLLKQGSLGFLQHG